MPLPTTQLLGAFGPSFCSECSWVLGRRPGTLFNSSCKNLSEYRSSTSRETHNNPVFCHRRSCAKECLMHASCTYSGSNVACLDLADVSLINKSLDAATDKAIRINQRSDELFGSLLRYKLSYLSK